METSLVMQVTPSVGLDDQSTLPTSNCWTGQENNATNQYNVVIPSGQVNNNNKNNSYAVLAVAELDRLTELLFDAEADCWRNKKNRFDAAKFHFHLSEVYRLRDLILSGEYHPTTSICFVLTYPRYREVFAAMYRDRVVHHFVAPFILSVTEKVHKSNGDISHGNRYEHSALTAALQIQSYLREYPDGYVATMDVSGFFMNICRQMAYDTFVKFCNMFRPSGYTDEEIELMLQLLYRLIMHDPTTDCLRNSPIEMWDFIAKNKTLFGNDGKGLPIGNFYSQLLANLVLAVWGMAIMELGLDCKISQFVDDMCAVAPTVEILNAVRKRSQEILESMQLRLHPTKFYIQPVRHGVSFCGRVIYADRIYINNRTVRACKGSIREAMFAEPNAQNARRLMCSFNAYMGFMYHCRSFNIQRELAMSIMESPYAEWLYFDVSHGKVVCRMFEEYKPINIHIAQIRSIKKYNKKLYRYERSKNQPGRGSCRIAQAIGR